MRDINNRGFDITCTNKRSKMQNEYFNPYGYNLYSVSSHSKQKDCDCTRTNQDSKIK